MVWCPKEGERSENPVEAAGERELGAPVMLLLGETSTLASALLFGWREEEDWKVNRLKNGTHMV